MLCKNVISKKFPEGTPNRRTETTTPSRLTRSAFPGYWFRHVLI